MRKKNEEGKGGREGKRKQGGRKGEERWQKKESKSEGRKRR